jgi:exosortase
MDPGTPSLPAESLSLSEAWGKFVAWARREPLSLLLLLACLGTVAYFFGFFHVFTQGTKTVAKWAWEAWNPENNQEHSRFILPISVFIVWYHRDKLAAAHKEPWNPGLAIAAFGVACFILGVRALQPRLAIVSLPIILIGAVGFLWGKQVARIVLFPCAFLLFMVPIGGLVQGTVSLQLLVSSVCNVLAGLIGMKIEAAGTTIRSLDNSFNFEIAEGCSGIRSLMAMSTLTALYVHFTQREWWKKGAVFVGSVVFAVVGNIGRIFTVILVARFISPTFAANIYHDYSGFVFFPIAVVAMVGFAQLVNLDWPALIARHTGSGPTTPKAGQPDGKAEEDKPGGPVSYDY